jgi:guanylate kinase
MKDQIYVAGKLNGKDSTHYIRNVNKMTNYAEEIRQLGVLIHNPANDFIHGVICGGHEYNEYWENNLGALKRADAVAMVDNWNDSPGAKAERDIAIENNIPVLYHKCEVEKWVKRPRILAVVGESGSGKTMAVDYIEKKYLIPMVRSYTDRRMRHPDEDGHTFLSEEEFDEIKTSDTLAYTEWQGKRYCCIHSDIGQFNTYVIDERGLSMLRNKWRDRYKVEALRIHRSLDQRSDIDSDRVGRDLGKFILHDGEYQYVVHNDGTKDELFKKMDNIVEGFFNEIKL